MKILKIVLALALVGGLWLAGRHVYRSLPAETGIRNEAGDPASKAELAITLRDTATPATVELYPIDYAATQREFTLQGRPGRSFDDYFERQLQKLIPLRVQIDQSGRALARLGEGNWWLRATSALGDGEVMEWRLPITISQSKSTVELSNDNAYARTKKF